MSLDTILWISLGVLVVGMLALDLFVFHRDAHEVRMREAAAWSVVWISLGLAFGGVVFLTRGSQAGGEYLAGYLIEKSLSMDNVFLFAMLFGYFAVPSRYQHRVLFWGVVGAIVFRAIFIAAGTTLLEAFHFLIYGFGILLLITGIKMWRSKGHAVDPQKNIVLRLVRRFVPMTDEYHGQRFFIRHAGKLVATPLFAVLVVVETTDIMFAIDSIPAIFAVTTDPFIVLSSNLFAILGLRALYFLLAGLIDKFVYLKQGLAALLVFAGVKILVADIYKMPIPLSLAVIIGILVVAVVASVIAARRSPRDGDLELTSERAA
ncbi:MAG TPA: TerC family protein [Candidatus Limnocylindrales bacterium]|nr:TerC family protein [Candidatus Limnocylindrales bacterium]